MILLTLPFFKNVFKLHTRSEEGGRHKDNENDWGKTSSILCLIIWNESLIIKYY